ncbi:unnamed protein product [Lasius platythorax]|uniref:Uncharacterized protein n=1 Tax=Lasius platythorax TaxID=488582 RepID=A0AAV2MZ42_9HYME
MLKQREKEEKEQKAVKRKNTKSYIVYAKRAKTSVSENIPGNPSDEEVVTTAEDRRMRPETEEEDESRRINGTTGEDPDRASESLDRVIVRETECKSHEVREKVNKSRKSRKSESSSDSAEKEKLIDISNVPLSTDKEKTLLKTLKSVKDKNSSVLSEKTIVKTIESDRIKKNSVISNANTIDSTNILDLSTIDIKENIITSTPKDVPKSSKNMSKLINNSLQSQKEFKNSEIESINSINVAENKKTAHKNQFRVRNINELKENDFVNNLVTENSSNKESSSLESQNLDRSNFQLSQESQINKLESKRNSNESLVIDMSDDTLSSDNENKETVSEKRAKDIVEVRNKLLEINKLRIMRDKALNNILELNNQTIDLRNKEKLDEFTSKIKNILQEIGEKQISAKKDGKIADKKKLLENSVRTIKNRLSERNSSESSIENASSSVKTSENTERKNNVVIENYETRNRTVYELTRCRGRASVVERGPKDRIQHGGLTGFSDKSRGTISGSEKQLTAKIKYTRQLERMREEEEALLRRIQRRIKLQATVKRQQERLNMLRRLAGEEEPEQAPTAAEVETITTLEEQRTAKVSETLFLALQAANVDRTFHRKINAKDINDESEYELDIVVAVKGVRQSASVVKAINIKLSIKGNTMESDVSFSEPKDKAIPQTIDKVIERFRVTKDIDCKKVTKSTECKAVSKEAKSKSVTKDKKPRIISDVKICIPRLKMDDKKVKTSRPVHKEEKQIQEERTEETVTETKKNEEEVEKEIAQLMEMSKAQKKRRSSSYCAESEDDDISDKHDGNDRDWKELPRHKRSRRRSLEGAMKPEASARSSSTEVGDRPIMEGKRSELQKAESALEVPKDEEPLPASQVPEMAKAEEVRTTMETEPDQETATPSQEAMEQSQSEEA